MEDERYVELIAPIPVSVNKLYTVVGGRNILSREGRAYKNRLRMEMAKQLLRYKPLGRNTPLSITYEFFFSTVLNKGYPSKAKTRFRRLDASNRVKVLEDVVCEVLDIDDSQVVHMEVSKWESREEPHVCVKVRAIPYDPIRSQR